MPGGPGALAQWLPSVGTDPGSSGAHAHVYVAWKGPEVPSVWNNSLVGEQGQRAATCRWVGSLFASCCCLWTPSLLSGPCISAQPTGHSRLPAVFCGPWPDSGLGFCGLPAWVALSPATKHGVGCLLRFPSGCVLCAGVLELSPSVGKASFSFSEPSRAVELVTFCPLGALVWAFSVHPAALTESAGREAGTASPFPEWL